MHILRDEAAISNLTDIPLRQLIQQRVKELTAGGPWDADAYGCFIVVEPGDPVCALEAALGFPVLRDLLTDAPFGDENFSPAFEWAEAHPEGFFEMVWIINDDGFGYDIFVVDQAGVDPDLLALCRSYATPAA